jgi:hypothetical protein
MTCVLRLASLLLHTSSLGWLGVLSTSGQTATQGLHTLNAGGGPATAGNGVHYGSMGSLGAMASADLPPLLNKTGFIGQLYEIDSLQLSAVPASVNEGATRQLTASQLLDDGTIIELDEMTVAWSVDNGPISAVSSSGVATAGLVYEDSMGTIEGVYAAEVGAIELLILNIDPDDYGSYAGDGLDDDWQVLYFGLSNPLAAPRVDADGDGQDNAFEFEIGVVPTDPLSRFRSKIESVPGFPGRASVTFSPRFSDRFYTLQSSLDLTPASWIDVPSTTVSDDGLERTLTDITDDGSTTKLYQVEVTRP